MSKILHGQLSVWDIETAKEEVVTKHKKEVKTTEELPHKDIVGKTIINNYIDHAKKIIKTCSGRYFVQLENETIHFTKLGVIDFKTKKQPSILQTDEIMYAKDDEATNNLQKRILLKVKSENNIKKIIKRYGDRNYIVITENDTLSINEKGWILSFDEAIYKESEVLKNKIIKIGDIVKVKYKQAEYIGEVVNMYGPKNSTLNIVFDNKHTAFYRDSVSLVY